MFFYAAPKSISNSKEFIKFLEHNKRLDLLAPTMAHVFTSANTAGNGPYMDRLILCVYRKDKVPLSSQIPTKKTTWIEYGELAVGVDKETFNVELVHYNNLEPENIVTLNDGTELNLCSIPADLPKVFTFNGSNSLATNWSGFEETKGLVEKYYKLMYEVTLLYGAITPQYKILKEAQEDPTKYNNEDIQKINTEVLDASRLIKERENRISGITYCEDAIKIINTQYALSVPEFALLGNMTVENAKNIILMTVLDREALRTDELIKKPLADVLAHLKD